MLLYSHKEEGRTDDKQTTTNKTTTTVQLFTFGLWKLFGVDERRKAGLDGKTSKARQKLDGRRSCLSTWSFAVRAWLQHTYVHRQYDKQTNKQPTTTDNTNDKRLPVPRSAQLLDVAGTQVVDRLVYCLWRSLKQNVNLLSVNLAPLPREASSIVILQNQKQKEILPLVPLFPSLHQSP